MKGDNEVELCSISSEELCIPQFVLNVYSSWKNFGPVWL